MFSLRLIKLFLVSALLASTAQAELCSPFQKDLKLDGFMLNAFQIFPTQSDATLRGMTPGQGMNEFFKRLNRGFSLFGIDIGNRVQTRNPLPPGDFRYSGFKRIFGANAQVGTGLNLTIDLFNNGTLLAQWRSTDDEIFTETYTCR
jgi:hypothetical protein